MRPTSSMRVLGVSAFALAASAFVSAQAQSSAFASNQHGGSAGDSLGDTLSAQAPSQQGAAIQAAEPAVQARPVVGSFTLSAGAGRVVHLNTAAANVFTADPKVAEVRPASANSLFVFGVAPGTTTVAALTGTGGAVAQYQVTVLPSGFDASQARNAIRRAEPHQSVITTPTETGVSLSGDVATPGDAEHSISAAKGVLPPDGKVDNRLKVDQPIQVGLHVRIAEMTRTLTRQLGVNWSAAGQLGSEVAIGVATSNPLPDVSIAPSEGGVTLGNLAKRGWDLTTVIDALSQDQLVHVLAEPNLTTMSGEPASFLVGGEFPIPIASANNTVSLEFKQYGISLAFVPTVISQNRISLHVRPEVSQLDKANGVTFLLGANNTNSGVSIPALTVRRADTTVELGSGQSFAIAGLLSDQTTQIGHSIPGIGDVPVLGALFRSDSFQRQETELVIVVTPYIVRPVSDPSALHLPSDGWRPPNDIERILELRQMGHTPYAAQRRIPADAGFMVE